MKLYTFPPAPNPRKLAVYLGEKHIEIPVLRVDLLAAQQSSPEFLAINPQGAVPVLELDDGTRLTESLAIIEYLEELNPEPAMIGRGPLERARVREAERLIDIGVLMRIARIVHNRGSPLPGVVGDAALADREMERLPRILSMVNDRIGSRPFVMGDRPTIADCSLFAALSFGEFFEVEVDPILANVCRWYAAFRVRPSAQF
ncbi:MAG: glutathione S-transferase family protein [Myxococcales bacterium]|nr:MAG: glutathione S-transferase family protein [Myxococcales bacterium]